MSMIPGFGFITELAFEGDPEYVPVTIEVIEAQPMPELPAECWNGEKPDGARCMAATRSLCGG